MHWAAGTDPRRPAFENMFELSRRLHDCALGRAYRRALDILLHEPQPKFRSGGLLDMEVGRALTRDWPLAPCHMETLETLLPVIRTGLLITATARPAYFHFAFFVPNVALFGDVSFRLSPFLYGTLWPSQLVVNDIQSSVVQWAFACRRPVVAAYLDIALGLGAAGHKLELPIIIIARGLFTIYSGARHVTSNHLWGPRVPLAG